MCHADLRRGAASVIATKPASALLQDIEVPGMGVSACVCFSGGMGGGFIDAFDREIRLAHPTESTTFFDWMRESGRSVGKVWGRVS